MYFCMDIRNSNEIIQDILGRYNFTAVYADSCNKFGIETSKNYVDVNDAIDFLYSSAVIGSKALGIFRELPFFHINVPLRSECLLITYTLPKVICTPVIIIKQADDIASKLTLAIKMTVEYKVPVTVVITANALNNYTSETRTTSDMGRISPYISASTFKQSFTQDELKEIYNNINNSLKETYNKEFNDEMLSLNSKEGFFPDFLLPYVIPDSIKAASHKNISVYENEKELMNEFFYENYGISLKLNTVADREFPEVMDLLCPGCPFVNIISNGINKDTIIFTDINCKGVFNKYPEINFIHIDGYMGIISSEVKPDTLFIGNASSYKAHYSKFLSKGGRVILLNDSAIPKIQGFTTIKHPKKVTVVKNTLYPYSCNNIKSYSRIKVKLKKCYSPKDNSKSPVFEATRCPALYKLSNNMMVDADICNGCLACKSICSKGVLS